MARPAHLDPARLTLLLQSSGVQSAQALAERVAADRVTVQRALRTLGPAVVQLGKTRATRYALRRSVFGQMNPHRISRLSQTGVAHEWVQLTALHGGWRLEWASPAVRPDWAGLIHDHTGFCEGLPFFLTDLRLQGFLGRAAARRLPATLGLPTDPRDWNDDQTLFYLREQGDDLPGNLTLGDGPTERALNAGAPDPVTPETRAARYPSLAAQASAGEPAGSSVEGEQPKFTTWLRASAEGPVFGVLVKFTDQLDTPTGRRWADLLAAEALALEALTQAAPADASAAPPPQTFDLGGRRFYELPRFDRVVQDAGFSGVDTNDWAAAAAGLHAHGWIGEADLRAVQLRRLFGRLIGNTDMHFGNLAFFLEPELPLRLAPTYDMLPMLWAPRPGEASPEPVFTLPAPLPQELTLWPEAATLAERFWERVEADPRISTSFRPHAAAALAALRTLRERFG